MPNKEEKQHAPKQHIPGDLQNEQLYEVDGIKGVHHQDSVEDSRANAHANKGGSGMGGGMGSGMGTETQSGMDSGLSGVSSGHLENTTGMGTGMGMGSGTGMGGGMTTEEQTDTPDIVGGLGTPLSTSGTPTENGDSGNENTSVVENQLEETQDNTAQSENIQNDPVASSLFEIIGDVKREEASPENTTREEVVSQNEENQQGTTNTAPTSTTGTTDGMSTPVVEPQKEDTTSQQILSLNPQTDTQEDPEDPNAQALRVAETEGRNAGLEAGCSAGLEKKVTKPENEFVIGDSLADEEAINLHIDGVKKELLGRPVENVSDPASVTKVKEKREQAFYSSFNHGYVMGRRMKVDLAKALLLNNEDYKQGTADGEQAGTLAGSGNDAEADLMIAAANAEGKTEEYKKGFFNAFNKKYTEARVALAAARHPSSEQLMGQSESYAKGYTWGESIGTGAAKNELSDEEINKASGLANQNKDANGADQPVEEGQATPLFQKGYFAGFNKGYTNGRQVVAATRKKANQGPEEGDPNHIHFIAGRFKGGLAGMMDESRALDALTNRSFDLSQVAENLPPIPSQIYEYFEQGTHLSIYRTDGLSEEEKQANSDKVKFFELGYFKELNKMYIAQRQNQVKRKHRERTNNPDYERGHDIGRIAGQAEAIRERLQQKITSLQQTGKDESSKIAEYTQTIEKISTNLTAILTTVNTANEHYQQGYYAAFSLAYQNEKVGAVASKRAARQNQAAQGAASGTDYGIGYETGTTFGQNIYKKLNSNPTPTEQQAYENSIAQAISIAEARSPDYAAGFLAAFNNAMLKGDKEGDAALDDGSKTLQEEYNAAQREAGNKENDKANKTYYQKFYAEGKDFAFNKYFKFIKEGGKNPEEDIKKKLSTILKEIKEASDKNNKDVDDEDRLPATFNSDPNAEKLKTRFKEGLDIGQRMGEQAGTCFKAGFEEAMGGEQASEHDYYYTEGYKAGQAASEYQNFRDAVFAASGLSDMTSSNFAASQYQNNSLPENQRPLAARAYQDGFNKHYNAWLKIHALLGGAQLGKPLNTTNINLLNTSSTSNPGGEVVLAKKMLEEKSTIISNLQGEKEAAFQAIVNEQEGEDNISVAQLLEEFKKGYEKAIDTAQKEIDNNLKDEVLYSIGLIHGINTDGFLERNENKALAEEILGRSKALADHLKGMQMTEDIYQSQDKYRQGKSRGQQIKTLISSGLGSLESFANELHGSAYNNAYNKGFEKGREEAESTAEAIQKGDPLPERDKNNQSESENLKGDALEGFNAGLNEGYNSQMEYLKGFYKAYNQATNESIDDDFDNTVEHGIQYRSIYQEGIRDGRNQGMLDKAAGTLNQGKVALATETLSMNLTIQNKIDQLRENDMDSRADGTEAGYQEAIQFVNSATNSDNLPALKSEFAQKGGASGIEKMSTKLEEMIEHITAANHSNQGLSDKFTLLLDNLKKIKPPTDTQSMSDKFKNASTAFLDLFKGISSGGNFEDSLVLNNLKTTCMDYVQEFIIGFEKAADLGLQDGARLKQLRANTEQPNTTNAADEFFNQLQNSVANEGELAYSKGYEEAVGLASRLVKLYQEMPLAVLSRFEHEGILNIKAALKTHISNDYRNYRNQNFNHENPDEIVLHHDTSLAYRKILTDIKVDLHGSPDDHVNLEEFINSNITSFVSEVSNLLDTFQNEKVKAYFENLLEKEWKRFIQVFRQGFHVGFGFGLQQGINRRDGATGQASSGADAELQAIHEMLMAGHVQDAYITDLDFIDSQDELRDRAYFYRNAIDEEENLIYATDNVIAKLLREINQNRELLEKTAPSSTNSNEDEDFSELSSLNLDLDEEDPKLVQARLIIETNQEKINVERDKIKEANAEIDANVVDYRQFMRESIHFEAPENSISALRDYLTANSANIELDGNFVDREGNAKSEGTGKVVIEDSRERIKYYGALLLGLGDLNFAAEGLERDDLEYFVTITKGTLDIPKAETSFKFDRLDFEMGIGMVEQLEQQLHLDDALTGGHLLSSHTL